MQEIPASWIAKQKRKKQQQQEQSNKQKAPKLKCLKIKLSDLRQDTVFKLIVFIEKKMCKL